MKKIRLTQDQHTLVDDEDYAWLMQWPWHAAWNWNTLSYYVRRKGRKSDEERCGLLIYMHREILGLKREDPREADHIHHDTLDNRRSELRIVTRRENLSNKRCGTSKYTGVSLNKEGKKWEARIHSNRKQRYIGVFDTEEEARDAYQEALSLL